MRGSARRRPGQPNRLPRPRGLAGDFIPVHPGPAQPKFRYARPSINERAARSNASHRDMLFAYPAMLRAVHR